MPQIVRFDTAIDAVRHADNGGMSLYVWDASPGAFADAPDVFKTSKRWAYLMCADKDVLVRVAADLGVKEIKVGREKRSGQHVDLCGRPLAQAIARSVPFSQLGSR